MYAHRMLLPSLLLTLGPPALAQEVPATFRHLKPHEIVEAVAAERQTLNLTDGQILRLESLHAAVLKEPHRFEPVPSQKLNHAMRMKPMISKQRAYADALAILTPEQRRQTTARFADPEYQLPVALRRVASEGMTADALQHHAVGPAPTQQALERARWADPLRHREAAEAPAVPGADREGAAPSPLTHRE